MFQKILGLLLVCSMLAGAESNPCQIRQSLDQQLQLRVGGKRTSRVKAVAAASQQNYRHQLWQRKQQAAKEERERLRNLEAAADDQAQRGHQEELLSLQLKVQARQQARQQIETSMRIWNATQDQNHGRELESYQEVVNDWESDRLKTYSSR